MVKNKKPFINKKNASTYQLIHRSQRDVAPDHDDSNENTTTTSSSGDSSRMILWPKEDNIHSTTLPSTDRAVLMGIEEEADEDDGGGGEGDDATDHDTGKSGTTSILSWKQQLLQMGVLDTVDHDKFLRPITGTGIFLDAKHGRLPSTSTTTTTNSTTATKSSFVVNDALLEVDRVMESLPLTTDCMDDDIAAILFAQEYATGDNDDDDNGDNMFQDYEELNDDFIFMATGMIPIDEGSNSNENNNNNNHDDDDDVMTRNNHPVGNFDFDAHIQQLINTAKLGRDKNHTVDDNNKDEDFFHKHWQKPLHHHHDDNDDDDDDLDDHNHDERNHHDPTNERYRFTYDDDNSVVGGGSSVYTTNSNFTLTGGGGAARQLNPDEERALCDKFTATLAEYDDDDDDDDDDDFGGGYEYGNVHAVADANPRYDDDDDESKTVQSCSIGVGRPLVGDAVIEAALDEYLLEREDDILIHGNADRQRRSGGSGFAVLVNKQMINAKVLDATTSNPLNNATANLDEMYPEQEPAIPIDEYIAMAQETLAKPKEKPPAEEIFIDGKSYYDERPRNPWDCESILSTYSNLDNNPITIGQSSTRNRRRRNMSKSKGDDHSVVSTTTNEPEFNFTSQHIQLSTKTGLPMGVFDRNVVDRQPDNDDDADDTCVSVNKGMKRSKDETPEEKRIRKVMIKREREVARIQKKVTKEVYNNEMQKHMPMISEDRMTGKTVFRFS